MQSSNISIKLIWHIEKVAADSSDFQDESERRNASQRGQ